MWGSRTSRFKDWQDGDYLAFLVNKELAGLAKVNGKPYYSKDKIWDDDLYPYRIPIEFVRIIGKDQRLQLLGEIRDALTSAWGTRYGWGIRNQQIIFDDPAEAIVKAILSRPDSLPKFKSNIEQLLQEEEQERKSASEKDKTGGGEGKVTEHSDEESLHSQTQNVLIKLGKTAGCSVWIAPNDRNRLFQGKPLGEDCLKTLPNLGLSSEMAHRISLIDIIWIKQKVPVCAFEVETTTAVYSGLLRMSDFISMTPVLNIKLYIVAPKDRQDKVRAEITRPTFTRVGLNDYCKFIPIEELQNLLSRVEGYGGYIAHSIVDKVAIGFGEDNED